MRIDIPTYEPERQRASLQTTGETLSLLSSGGDTLKAFEKWWKEEIEDKEVFACGRYGKSASKAAYLAATERAAGIAEKECGEQLTAGICPRYRYCMAHEIAQKIRG
jgi:hypothetical protein